MQCTYVRIIAGSWHKPIEELFISGNVVLSLHKVHVTVNWDFTNVVTGSWDSLSDTCRLDGWSHSKHDISQQLDRITYSISIIWRYEELIIWLQVTHIPPCQKQYTPCNVTDIQDVHKSWVIHIPPCQKRYTPCNVTDRQDVHTSWVIHIPPCQKQYTEHNITDKRDVCTSWLCLLWIAVNKSVEKPHQSEVGKRITIVWYLLSLQTVINII